MNGSFQMVLFYLFSAILLGSAWKVITAKNPVHAVLFLVLAFVTASAHWLLLKAEFLAIALILVYVGAVMVLFLFVVMMLDINFEEMRTGFWKNFPLALTVSAIMLAELLFVFLFRGSSRNIISSLDQAHPLGGEGASNVKMLGLQLYTDYVYPFQLAAVMLLVAIVAAIALTMRRRKDSRYVDPAKQVLVRREDRVRLIKMPAEES
jgi:NADH-quinone oxidoreductase subunit J